MVTLRELPAQTLQANPDTLTVQFAELQAGTGRLVRVLRTQTVRYDSSDFGLQSRLYVLSLSSDGRYALVQGLQFGWLDVGGPDPGQFRALSTGPALQFGGPAAW